MVDICSEFLGETVENGMCKVGKRCGAVWVTIGTLVKHYLKALNGAMQVIGMATLPVKSVCLVCCISGATDHTMRMRGLDDD
jgi:hypothetical protein